VTAPEPITQGDMVDKVPLLTAVARLFRGIDLCRSEPMEEADLVMRIPHNILTLDALRFV
jgi:hypothetical protein